MPGRASAERNPTRRLLESLSGAIWKERSTGVIVAVTALMGLLFSIVVLGTPFIVGKASYWATVTGDQAQALIGWIAYRQDAWRFPLMDVRTLAYPVGTNLLFTDSIPLLALPAKLTRGLLPSSFQYFGYWLALCYVLQAVGMAALARAAGHRSFGAGFASSGLGLTSLILLRRFPHPALNAHFLILFALAAYLMARRDASRSRWLVAMLGLTLISLLVHPYLAAMVGFLSAVGIVEVAIRTRRWWRGIRLAGLGAIGAVGIVLVCYGVNVLSGPSAPGYGYYSLNLLGPVVPQLSGIVPNGWTVIDATGGQLLEGYSYLGSGVLLLAAVGVVFARSQLAAWLRKYWVMGSALVTMTLFALSNVLTAGETTLADLPLPGEAVAPVLGALRSSGRFFWPVAASITLVGLVAVLRRFRRGPALGLLVVALVLQLVDASLLIGDLRAAVRFPRPAALDLVEWSQAATAASVVRIEPPHRCLETDQQIVASLAIQRVAAEVGRPVTTAAAARTTERCPQGTRNPVAPEDLQELVVWIDVQGAGELPDSCSRTPVGIACGGPARLLKGPGT